VGCLGRTPTCRWVKIGELFVRADSVQPVPQMAGVFHVNVRVPNGTADGPSLPLASAARVLAAARANREDGVRKHGLGGSDGFPQGSHTSGGSALQRNTVTLAVEPAR
jgi:hypothetical protein